MPNVRPRVRFTLGVLMVVVLAIGGGLGWIAHRARVQRQAVAAILKSGGQVYYDWQYMAGRLDLNSKPGGPEWVRRVVPVDFLDTVANVDVRGTVDDSLMEQIGRLDGIVDLSIRPGLQERKSSVGAMISPAGFAHLANLRQLRHVMVSRIDDGRGLLKALKDARGLELLAANTKLADEEMVHLAGLTNLTNLNLGAANLTDNGYVHVGKLKNLTRLRLMECQITDRGFATFGGLTSLQELLIRPSRGTDPAPRLTSLTPLAGLNDLKRIDISGYPIEDRGLAGFERLGHLEWLDVRGSRITDAGLDPILGLPELAVLNLRDATITEQGLARLLAIKPLRILGLGPAPLQSLEPIRSITSGLRNINLTGCPIDDAGIAALARACQLSSLTLINAQFTDEGLAPLADLSTLRELNLYHTPIGDASVEHLIRIPELATLRVEGTQITDAGVARLMKARPELQIHWKGPRPR